jgi:hypothetical protein
MTRKQKALRVTREAPKKAALPQNCQLRL